MGKWRGKEGMGTPGREAAQRREGSDGGVVDEGEQERRSAAMQSSGVSRWGCRRWRRCGGAAMGAARCGRRGGGGRVGNRPPAAAAAREAHRGTDDDEELRRQGRRGRGAW
ncbi:hypothetical protein OsI_26577 [Oryza sativa Indica Group]|uniref:Uncharacterized protein n=1 Tax=Oryza sativa subsp. indica TaxID=39946 RepID=A2YMX0_ORYSI|nr:hypothetical protein OsI_26577 [Oryza sativa Indica Group]